MMSSPIPAIYRIWFLGIDLILSLAGVLGNTLTPNMILNSYNPSAVSPPSIEATVLLDSVAGFMLMCLALQIFLLRPRPTDVPVWRTVQGSILLVDLSMVASMVKALVAQDRADPASWRIEEWANIGITGACAVIRTAFCLGIGMEASSKAKST